MTRDTETLNPVMQIAKTATEAAKFALEHAKAALAARRQKPPTGILAQLANG